MNSGGGDTRQNVKISQNIPLEAYSQSTLEPFLQKITTLLLRHRPSDPERFLGIDLSALEIDAAVQPTDFGSSVSNASALQLDATISPKSPQDIRQDTNSSGHAQLDHGAPMSSEPQNSKISDLPLEDLEIDSKDMDLKDQDLSDADVREIMEMVRSNGRVIRSLELSGNPVTVQLEERAAAGKGGGSQR